MNRTFPSIRRDAQLTLRGMNILSASVLAWHYAGLLFLLASEEKDETLP